MFQPIVSIQQKKEGNNSVISFH